MPRGGRHIDTCNRLEAAATVDKSMPHLRSCWTVMTTAALTKAWPSLMPRTGTLSPDPDRVSISISVSPNPDPVPRELNSSQPSNPSCKVNIDNRRRWSRVPVAPRVDCQRRVQPEATSCEPAHNALSDTTGVTPRRRATVQHMTAMHPNPRGAPCSTGTEPRSSAGP